MKLLTIITESALEQDLLADAEALGAHGYTVTEAHGKGNRGVRSGSWTASSNIRVEIVCDPATAQAIAQHMQAKYYEDFAMILYLADVEVLRPQKF